MARKTNVPNTADGLDVRAQTFLARTNEAVLQAALALNTLPGASTREQRQSRKRWLPVINAVTTAVLRKAVEGLGQRIDKVGYEAGDLIDGLAFGALAASGAASPTLLANFARLAFMAWASAEDPLDDGVEITVDGRTYRILTSGGATLGVRTVVKAQR